MNIETPCAFPGCARTVLDEGVVFFRVNPKGVPGIFMCQIHARAMSESRSRRTGPARSE